MWFPERGLPNQQAAKAGTFCASGAELAADCGWGWCDKNVSGPGQPSVQEMGLAALATLAANLTQWPVGRLCRGHSDIFYVPTRFMASFARFAPALRAVFHEAAVPTLLHLVLWEANARDQFEFTHCNGSCCDRAGDDLGNYTCAHRLDLTNRTVVQNVVLALLP